MTTTVSLDATNPTAAKGSKPLSGLSILLLEDSRYFAEAVRLMTVRSGARIRRAVSLRTARRHLRSYFPNVVLVDLGLPDGSGIELIRELAMRPDGGPATIAISGNDDGALKTSALEAGARCFLSKPMKDLASFQQVILSVVPQETGHTGFSPRLVGTSVEPSPTLLVDDLTQISEMMRTAANAEDITQMSYAAQFLRSIGRAAQDHELNDAAASLAARLRGGDVWASHYEACLALVEKRLTRHAAH